MEFRETVLTRYAARAFTKDQIPEKTITEILELIRWTPSGLNIQPWRIRVVADPKTKEELAKAAWGQRHVAECSHLLVLCAENDLDGQIGRLDNALVEARVSDAERARTIGFIRDLFSRVPAESLPVFMKNQVFLALATALYAAKSLGVDSCPVTGFEAEQVSRILGLPPQLVPVALCPLGYGADSPRARVRVPLSQILI
jgi:nitroreductase / dihydropteridine reductase